MHTLTTEPECPCPDCALFAAIQDAMSERNALAVVEAQTADWALAELLDAPTWLRDTAAVAGMHWRQIAAAQRLRMLARSPMHGVTVEVDREGDVALVVAFS